MSMPREEIFNEMNEAWSTYMTALERSLDALERDIREASEMADACTSEWCESTEHVIDELANALFSISEPRWTDKAQSDRIKTLKRRVYDLYAEYRKVYRNVA
ncbi:MAG: hypothetical protein ACOWWM_21025 [Desulfobacterales bacterium]